MPLQTHPGHIPTSKIYPLQYRKILKKLLVMEVSASDEGRRMWRTLIGIIFLMGLLFIAVGNSVGQESEQQFNAVFTIYFLAVLMIVLGMIIYEWLYVITYFYDVGETFLRIRKGVLIRREVSVPYNQIQSVDVDQDVFDRILGLYDVHVSTAAEKYLLVPHIDGLSYKGAEKILELIHQEIEGINRPVSTAAVTPEPPAASPSSVFSNQEMSPK